MADEYDTVNRDEIAGDLERARIEFHRLLALAGPDDWGKPTRGTRWTNEQLLFHMVFGYMVVQRLLILVRIFSRLPDPVSRMFANILDSATKPFHLINYYGSCCSRPGLQPAQDGRETRPCDRLAATQARPRE